MIGYNALGRNGRLGNQMFQYAALKGIAANRGYEYCIPADHHQLFDGFNMPSARYFGLLPDESTVGDGHFHFNQQFFHTCPDNVNLIGYFQTQKYFEHIAEEIKTDFTFRTPIQIKARMYLDQIKKERGSKLLCLHVRRGDYISYQDCHALCTLEYYEQALSRFDSDTVVLLVSDDKDWFLEQSLFKQDRFIVVDKDFDLFTDMCILSMVDNHIISNSTFAWWGAWLSRKKQIVAPLQWFGPANAYVDTKDLIPTEWERL